MSVGCHPLGLVVHFSPTRSSKKFPAPVVPSLSEPWRRRDVPRAGRRPPRRAARGSPPSGRPSAARRGARRSAAPAGASPRRSPRRPEALVRLSPHRVSRVGCVASSCCGLQKLCLIVCVCVCVCFTNSKLNWLCTPVPFCVRLALFLRPGAVVRVQGDEALRRHCGGPCGFLRLGWNC